LSIALTKLALIAERYQDIALVSLMALYIGCPKDSFL